MGPEWAHYTEVIINGTEGAHRRTIVYDSPVVRIMVRGQLLTNGLGFFDMPEEECDGKIPHYDDTQEGLIRHLVEMDNRVTIRKERFQDYIAGLHLGVLIGLEDELLGVINKKRKMMDFAASRLGYIGEQFYQLVEENDAYRRRYGKLTQSAKPIGAERKK